VTPIAGGNRSIADEAKWHRPLPPETRSSGTWAVLLRIRNRDRSPEAGLVIATLREALPPKALSDLLAQFPRG
jgi:hypothetical protein